MIRGFDERWIPGHTVWLKLFVTDKVQFLYRVTDRQAKVGDYAVTGTVNCVYYVEKDPKESRACLLQVPSAFTNVYAPAYTYTLDEFLALEPTDRVIVQAKEYRRVERYPEIGDSVAIVNDNRNLLASAGYSIDNIFEVEDCYGKAIYVKDGSISGLGPFYPEHYMIIEMIEGLKSPIR